MKTFAIILLLAIGFGLFIGTSLKSCTVNASDHADRQIAEAGL